MHVPRLTSKKNRGADEFLVPTTKADKFKLNTLYGYNYSRKGDSSGPKETYDLR